MEFDWYEPGPSNRPPGFLLDAACDGIAQVYWEFQAGPHPRYFLNADTSAALDVIALEATAASMEGAA